jgi:exopolysaccharide biosynthesis protein
MFKKIALILCGIIILFLLFDRSVGFDEIHKNLFEQEIRVDSWEVKYFEGSVDHLLFDNTKERLTLSEIIEKNNCQKVINAGFYKTTNGKHQVIGYFAGENYSQPFENNVVFNGIVNLDKKLISYNPAADSNVGFQSGPVLIYDGNVQSINSKSEDKSRRMASFIDVDGKLYFAAIYQKDSVFLGPKLSKLPEIIIKLGEQENIEIVSAINLDGGGASFFFDGETKLTEAKIVGSYLCYK